VRDCKRPDGTTRATSRRDGGGRSFRGRPRERRVSQRHRPLLRQMRLVAFEPHRVARNTLTSGESLGLRQPHPAQQVSIARVGAHPVPSRVYRQIGQAGRTLFVTFFKQPERLVFVAEAPVNLRNLIEIDITVRGRVPGELLRGPILPANRAAKGSCLSLFERTW
jgi:hypothetical protein